MERNRTILDIKRREETIIKSGIAIEFREEFMEYLVRW